MYYKCLRNFQHLNRPCIQSLIKCTKFIDKDVFFRTPKLIYVWEIPVNNWRMLKKYKNCSFKADYHFKMYIF